MKPDMTALESHAAFWLEAGDHDSGLRSVKVTVVQKEVRAEVVSKNIEPPGGFGPAQVVRSKKWISLWRSMPRP